MRRHGLRLRVHLVESGQVRVTVCVYVYGLGGNVVLQVVRGELQQGLVALIVGQVVERVVPEVRG